MKLTISGLPGSGKTTAGQLLARDLNLKFISIGNLRGSMATERGITLEDLNKLGETESWTDDELDNYQKKFGRENNDFIMEGRLAYFLIPDSIKIFLTVDPVVGAERIYKNPRPDEKQANSIEEETKKIAARIESDKKRFKKYYGVDPYDRAQYDIVVDTTNLKIEDTLNILLNKIQTLTNK